MYKSIRIHVWWTVPVLLSTVIFYSCRKDDSVNNDSRKHYVGRYRVKETITCYCYSSTPGPVPGHTCHTEKDTIISVYAGESPSALFLLGKEITINEDGYGSD